MEQLWGDYFFEATQAILDALSHVDEFDRHEFTSSVFISSKSIEDASANVARGHAERFIKTANTVIKTLMTYRPKDNENPEKPESWWRGQAHYERACYCIARLHNWVDVIQSLQKSIDVLTGKEFKTTRQELLTFKKMCEEALNGLNNIILTYNRFVAINREDFKLTPVLIKS